VRIKGLVAASNRVWEQLKAGLSAQHTEQFRQYVLATLHTTERLCASAYITPNQLPTPSRKAYDYLNQLDLDDLPLVDASCPSESHRTITLRNVRAQHQQIQSVMSEMASRRSPLSPSQAKPLLHMLEQSVIEIEQICDKNALTPAHLAGNSKPLYAWMKYLLEDQHLFSHLETVQQMQQSLQTLDKRKGSKGFGKPQHRPSKPVSVELTNMAALYRFRDTPKSTQLQLSEGFIAADDPVLAALAKVVRFGKSAEQNQIITRFSLSEAFSEILVAMDLLVGEMASATQGHAYNLDEIFNQVNRAYFKEKLSKPQLAWSQSFTQRKYGHYEPSRDRVVLSRTLDNPKIPSYVVEFVMYHELLHKHHGEVWLNGRQRVHTPAFRKDERQFKQYALAEAFLKQLAVT
jgi:hypothetical protein